MAFAFHANTLAFGGQRSEHGLRRLLPSQASVTLPPEGGFGESAIENYSEDGVSIYRAESRVYGSSYRNRLFKTYANVSVYGLDIAGMVQADVLSASITSINERVNDCTSESKISFDANIIGLVIAGEPYNVEIDTTPFSKHGTFGEFTSAFARMSEYEVRRTADAYNWPYEECVTEPLAGPKRFHVPERCKNGLRATIVRNITPAVTGGKLCPPRQGFSIEVAGLGVLHLGEVQLTTGRRSINLLRVDLGQSLGGVMRIDEAVVEENAPRPMALALASAPEGDTPASGGYTVAHATGNGTDFGPP